MRKLQMLMMVTLMGSVLGCIQQQRDVTPTLTNPAREVETVQETISRTNQIYLEETDTHSDNNTLPIHEGESPFVPAPCSVVRYDDGYGLRPSYPLSFSPDGKHMTIVTPEGKLMLVTFERDREITLAELDVPFPVYQAAWSPIGEQIAVAAKAADTELQQVYIFDSKEMNQMQAVGQPYPFIHHLAWSPDEKYLAYAHSLAFSYSDIVEVSPTGFTYPSEILISLIDMKTQTTIQEIPSERTMNIPVGWLSDNLTLVIEKLRFEEAGGKIMTYNMETTELRSLTPNNACDLYPSISPDGTEIVFSSMSDPEASIDQFLLGMPDIFIMQADGADRRRLTDTPSVIEFAPVWSPNGESVAYNVIDDNVGEETVFILDIFKLESAPIATFNALESVLFSPAWIPVSNQPVIVRTIANDNTIIRFSRYEYENNALIDLVGFEFISGILDR